MCLVSGSHAESHVTPFRRLVVIILPSTRLEQVEALQNVLIAQATSSGDNATYVQLRRELLSDAAIAARLPKYVRTCGDLSQFWQFIKYEYATYRERRDFIWNGFRPLLDFLAGVDATPADDAITLGLTAFDREHVTAVWSKALERRSSDPEGAITAARTLLETICKHILDGYDASYPKDADLPKLYALTVSHLQLAPSQQQEQLFKQILGACQTVVEGLGAIRNRLGDSHGQGKKPVKPVARHAELAVNLAGSMALFLVATYDARHQTKA